MMYAAMVVDSFPVDQRSHATSNKWQHGLLFDALRLQSVLGDAQICKTRRVCLRLFTLISSGASVPCDANESRHHRLVWSSPIRAMTASHAVSNVTG